MPDKAPVYFATGDGNHSLATAKEYYNPKSGTPSALQMRVGFITGAQWADKTILKEVLEWLEENFSEHEDFSFDFVEDTPYQCPVICDFESKEQMLQSFKERFNTE